MERLTTARRREIDAVHLRAKSVGDRMLNSEGNLMLGGMSETTRTHHLNTVDYGYKYFIEHGVHPAELGMWIQAVFQWIRQQREVPDVGCEVGPAPIKRW